MAELRPAEGNAAFYLGLIALRQARWGDAVESFRSAVEQAGAAARRAPQPGARARAAGPARRGGGGRGRGGRRARATTPGRCCSGAWWRCKREDPEVAEGRLAKARELFGDPAGAAALVLGGGARRRIGRGHGARRGHRAGGRRPRGRTTRCCGTTWRCCWRPPATLAEAEQVLRAALAEEPSLPQLSKNLGDLLYRAGRYEDAQEAFDRAAKLAPDLGDDLYFKLGNLAFRAAGPGPRARLLAARRGAQPGAPAGALQPRDPGRARVIVDDEEGFKALTRRVSREAGLTLDAYKDKCLRRRLAGPDARVQRAYLRRVHGRARPEAGGVGEAARTRSRST